MKKLLSVLLAFTMLTSLLAGCSGNNAGSDQPDNTTQNQTQGTKEPEQSAETKPPAEEAKKPEPTPPPAEPIDYCVSEIYVPETGLVNPPAVIQKITTALPDTEAGPAVALMEIDADLNAVDEAGSPLFAVEEFISSCSAKVIPAFLIDSEAEAEALAAFITAAEIIDALVVADSTNAALVVHVRQLCKELRGALIFDDVSDKEIRKAACRLVNDSMSNIVISRKPLSVEEVSYLNIRAIAAWNYIEDDAGVYQAIASGCGGVITTDPDMVYEVYSSITNTTVTGQPLPISHRGNRAFPENTLTSFQGALDAGTLAVETDLRLTRDKEVVLLHDETVNRTTDGTYEIYSHSLEQVKEFTCDDMPGMTEKIPTFKEALEQFGDTDLVFYCEMKVLSAPMIEQFNELVKGYEDNVVFFASFKRMAEWNHTNVADGISFVAADYEDILQDEDDLLTIEKFIRNLSPYNYQPLFYDYTPNHDREDFYYEMAARGFVSNHSTTSEKNLPIRLLTEQGANAALSNEPWSAADYAYKINAVDLTLPVRKALPLYYNVTRTVGSARIKCDFVQLSGPELKWVDRYDGYVAEEAGEAVVVFRTTVTLRDATYDIYSSPVTITVTA